MASDCLSKSKERKGKERKGKERIINNCCAFGAVLLLVEDQRGKPLPDVNDLILFLPVAVLGMSTLSPKHFCLLALQLELPYVKESKMINSI